jgi:hypothetical protein
MYFSLVYTSYKYQYIRKPAVSVCGVMTKDVRSACVSHIILSGFKLSSQPIITSVNQDIHA